MADVTASIEELRLRIAQERELRARLEQDKASKYQDDLLEQEKARLEAELESERSITARSTGVDNGNLEKAREAMRKAAADHDAQVARAGAEPVETVVEEAKAVKEVAAAAPAATVKATPVAREGK